LLIARYGNNEKPQKIVAKVSQATLAEMIGTTRSRVSFFMNKFRKSPGEACQNENCKADIRGVKSATARLRFHDLRHHAITELAESQASDQTVMAIAGHVSSKMLAHYSHVRMDAKRKALDALSREGLGASYGTNHDTNALSGAVPHPQVIEINGRLVGTRTPDLHRVKVAL